MNGTGKILKDYVDCIIETTKRHNVYLIDLFKKIELDPYDQSLVPDGLHPNDKGHEILAKIIGKKLMEL